MLENKRKMMATMTGRAAYVLSLQCSLATTAVQRQLRRLRSASRTLRMDDRYWILRENLRRDSSLLVVRRKNDFTQSTIG